MDLFSVSISYEIFILADDAAGAERIAAEFCEDANSVMPGREDFRYSASKAYNQSEKLKSEALNFWEYLTVSEKQSDV